MANMQKAIQYIQKAEKHIYKFRYVLEFIFSLIATFGVYKLITIKHYSGYYDKTYLLLSAMYVVLALAVLIYCCYKDKEKIEKMFITFIIPIGMLYLVFMVPSHVPDEQAHMWKAYEVSTGKLVTHIEEDGSSHTEVPKELLEYVPGKVAKYNTLIGKIEGKTNYDDTTKITSPAQNYRFVLYIGSALGFLIARIFSLNILIGIYLGKIFNFILFIVAGYYTIKTIPFGKLLMATYLFIPMMLHQAISFSADSITNMVSIFYIAYLLKLLFQKEKFETKQGIFLTVLSILVGIVKMAYAPLLGLSMMLLFNKNMTKKQKAIIPVSIILGGIAAIAMYILSMQYVGTGEISGYNEQNNINSSEQIHYMIENPKAFLGVLKNDWLNKGETYVNMLIGSNLGWLNILVNKPIITVFIIVILFSIIVENNNKVLNNKQRIWMLLMSVFTVVLTETVLYISWSGVGSGEILGIQGRYFIPVAIVALLPLCMKNNYLKFKNISLKLPIIVSVLNVLVIQALYTFFA